jgi:hypothetical protein
MCFCAGASRTEQGLTNRTIRTGTGHTNPLQKLAPFKGTSLAVCRHPRRRWALVRASREMQLGVRPKSPYVGELILAKRMTPFTSWVRSKTV